MMAARTLLAAVCLTLPIAAQPPQAQQATQAQKEWFLGAGAMVAQIDGDRLDLLGGTNNIAEVAAARRQTLLVVWEIRSRQDLLEEIENLLHDDRDLSRIGWNYPRAINLARFGYAAGYLQEDEAWGFIVPAAERLQKTFSSWQELGQVYLEARAKWYSSRVAYRRQAEYAYRVLLTDQDSPWRKYPWNLDLGNGYQAAPSIDKTAWIELAAHPEGLMCVRITVPEHRDELQYEDAIEAAVGCRPHITGQRRNGPDWVLDTECFQPQTLHGAEIVAQFHPEAIAEQLRREGVTQLITFFEHKPHGSASELLPVVSDNWFQDGWQWYLDMRSLRRPFPDTTLTYGVPPARVRAFLAGAVLFAAASLLGAFAVRGRAWGTSRFPLFFWGTWLVLSVTYYGLAIAGFWSGGEGLGADVRGLVWYGTLALLLRWGTEIIIASSAWRAIVPNMSLGRILFMSFSRVMAEVPVATVMVLLCDPQRPLNLATVIALLGFGAAIALTAWHFRMRAEGLRGGLANAGELHDAVWAMAKRMGVPLRRLYILPEEVSPRLGPKAGSHRDLLIPERLLRSVYRREMDGIVGYQLMLIKTKYVNAFWAGLLPVAVVLVWRIYNAQNASSANVTLVMQAGMMVSAFATFGQTLRGVHKRAQAAFKVSGGDAEGWIAGLARLARLSGTEVAPGLPEQIARQCGVELEHLPHLVETGFPETGHYAVPVYDHHKLVPVS
jgi:hypothetical protein